MRKPSLLVIFLAVFMDLIGFGIVLPLLPIYSRNFGASGPLIGLIMASYSMMQFACSPMWGRLSDRIGRRPVILISTAGSALSYALFAFGSGQAGTTALAVLLISRVFAGICGTNITVAQAYIADITPPEDRSKRMGLIGMAFGLGFILGPALGAFAAKYFGPTGPGWVAASLCATNFILATFLLPESLKPNSEHVPQRPHLDQWLHTMQRPKVGFIIGIFFLATFCFTSFELTLGLLVGQNFHLDSAKSQDATTIGILFAYCGIVGAAVQGGAIGRLVRKLGEPMLIAASLFCVAVSLAALPFIKGTKALSWHVLTQPEGFPWWQLLVVLGILSVGSSLTRPPIFGLISILTPAREQGATLGIAQSAGSLARIFGPLFAGAVFERHPAMPYLICSGGALVASMLTWQVLCKATLPLAQPEMQAAE
jgi:multidrug resistance protein